VAFRSFGNRRRPTYQSRETVTRIDAPAAVDNMHPASRLDFATAPFLVIWASPRCGYRPAGA
jgi:hypothetical protein